MAFPELQLNKFIWQTRLYYDMYNIYELVYIELYIYNIQPLLYQRNIFDSFLFVCIFNVLVYWSVQALEVCKPYR